jgi:hypothetical protein
VWGQIKKAGRGARSWLWGAIRWPLNPPSHGASLLAFAAVVVVLVLQLGARDGKADATSLGLLGLAILLGYATFAPGPTGRAVTRITNLKVAGLELGMAQVEKAEQVKPPPYEEDDIVPKRGERGYGEMVHQLEARLRFVRKILELQPQVRRPHDYVGIARELWTRRLLKDHEARLLLDVIEGREPDLDLLPESVRDEYLDATWSFAVRFGSMVWDRHVRRELKAQGWFVTDFEQEPGHRPDFLVYRDRRWVAIAARVGGAQEVKLYQVARNRLNGLPIGLPLHGRWVVIPRIRKATVLSRQGAGSSVKVLRLATIQGASVASLLSAACNDDERRASD